MEQHNCKTKVKKIHSKPNTDNDNDNISEFHGLCVYKRMLDCKLTFCMHSVFYVCSFEILEKKLAAIVGDSRR